MAGTDVTLGNVGVWTGKAPEIGIAGEAIDVNMAVYLNLSDNRYYKAIGNSANASKLRGFAASRAMAAGQQISVATGDGKITGLSGLVVGAPYFLSETTAGALMRVADLSTGDWPAFAGFAESASIFVPRPQYIGIQHA